MTTIRTTSPSCVAPVPVKRFRLPDIPERDPEDMTSYDSLHRYGAAANLREYLGSPESTIVSAEHYVVPGPAYVSGESRYPDLLVAFGVSPASYRERNGYVVSEQGKAPDFIMEVGSRQTASADLGEKKDYYEELGVGELWLYDGGGEYYGFTLRGYRLVEGRYEEITMREIGAGVFEGYSTALRLNLRGEAGWVGWHDPVTGEHIPTLVTERARAAAAEARATAAETRATAEAVRAASAEARVRELEAENRRLREGR